MVENPRHRSEEPEIDIYVVVGKVAVVGPFGIHGEECAHLLVVFEIILHTVHVPCVERPCRVIFKRLVFPRDVASIDIEEFVSHRSAVGTQVLQTCGARSPPRRISLPSSLRGCARTSRMSLTTLR